MKELIRIEGYVDIFQWDQRKYRHPFHVPWKERIYYVRNARNVIVENLAKFIIANLLSETLTWVNTGGTERTLAEAWYWHCDGSKDWDGPELGRDTSTPTTRDMYQLVDPINVTRDSFLKTYAVSANEAYVTITNTWNAGKITDTIGEVGLLGHAARPSAVGPVWEPALLARLASADGAFKPFTPDPTYALTVSYKLRFW